MNSGETADAEARVLEILARHAVRCEVASTLAELASAFPPEVVQARLRGFVAAHPRPLVRFHGERLLRFLAPVTPAVPVGESPGPADVARALASDDAASRAAAATALGKIPRPEALRLLAAAFRSPDPDPWVLATLLAQAAALKLPGAAEEAAVLLEHPAPRVAANALSALARIEPRTALFAAQPRLDSDDNRMRANAILITAPVQAELAWAKARQMVASEHVWMRASGVHVAQRLDPPPAPDLLAGILVTETDHEIMLRVAAWLPRKARGEGLVALGLLAEEGAEPFRSQARVLLERASRGTRLKAASLSRAVARLREARAEAIPEAEPARQEEAVRATLIQRAISLADRLDEWAEEGEGEAPPSHESPTSTPSPTPTPTRAAVPAPAPAPATRPVPTPAALRPDAEDPDEELPVTGPPPGASPGEGGPPGEVPSGLEALARPGAGPGGEERPDDGVPDHPVDAGDPRAPEATGGFPPRSAAAITLGGEPVVSTIIDEGGFLAELDRLHGGTAEVAAASAAIDDQAQPSAEDVQIDGAVGLLQAGDATGAVKLLQGLLPEGGGGVSPRLRWALASVFLEAGDAGLALQHVRQLDGMALSLEDLYSLACRLEDRGIYAAAADLFDVLRARRIGFRDVDTRRAALVDRVSKVPERVTMGLGAKYRDLSLLGVGGMGKVYRGVCRRRGEAVALKVPDTGTLEKEGSRERFQREARALARLAHPATVKVFEVGDGELPYLAMELLPGGDLEGRLRESGAFDLPGAMAVMTPVAAALAAAHAAGVIHRDVKPSNILFDAAGAPRLTDFGVAHVETGTIITRTGVMVGTMQYMAPEQVEGGEVTPAADVYAFGATLYEMLAGVPPFPPENPLLKLYRPPTPLAEARPELGGDAAWVVESLLARDPAHRPADGAELLAALKGVGSAGA